VVTRTVFDSVGFRGVLLMVLVPLALALAASRLVVESERFLRGHGERVAHPLRLDLGDGLGPRLAVLAAVTAAAAAVTGPSNTLLFVYAENVLDLSPTATAALTVAGGPTGLAGLLLGRAASDRFGRRVTAGVGLALLASSVLVAYSGTAVALVPGFLAGVLFGSVFATPALALSNELFPTAVRASAAGWLVVSGVLGATAGLFLVGATADRFGGFAPAFAMVCVPAIAVATLLARLPETRGIELEASSSSARHGTAPT
jgi:MFS family permease